jgi:hypothetical protein
MLPALLEGRDPVRVLMVAGACYLAGFGFALGVSQALQLAPLTIQQNTTVRHAQ